MNRTTGIVLLAAMVASIGAAVASDTRPVKPIELKDKASIKATVEAIDKAERTLTVKGPKGKIVTLAVDQAVTRFDQIKVGDVINVDYYESILVEVHKAGEKPLEASVSGGVAPKEGTKPAGVAVVQETMTVTIEAIDVDTPAVTVRTVDGNSLSFRVQKKKNLKNVSVGDQVVVTRTAGLAIDVTEGK